MGALGLKGLLFSLQQPMHISKANYLFYICFFKGWITCINVAERNVILPRFVRHVLQPGMHGMYYFLRLSITISVVIV